MSESPTHEARLSPSQGLPLPAELMFGCEPGDVDGPMVDDSLSELANIVAGQIKT